MTPFLYFIGDWWRFFSFSFAVYLFIFMCAAGWKDFMKWY